MDNDLKKIGIEVFKWGDGFVLYGTGSLSIKIVNLIKSKIRKKNIPLDWNGKNWHEYYQKEKNLLWIRTKDGNKYYLPQSILIDPDEAQRSFDNILVSLVKTNFVPPYKIEDGLDFYRGGGQLFDAENARLISYNKNDCKMIFQGAQYFDWVMTNLSLDFDRSPLLTLRQETSEGQKLQNLENCPLANITGINGLLFSNDGYMIYQQRNKNVLIRPNQLCSGFSGTIDKIDIENLVGKNSPKLSNMDTVREAVEEVGISRGDVAKINFLGVSRELIRGGTPEMFYAVDLKLTRNNILKCIPKDKEGFVKSVNFGKYARSEGISSGSRLPRKTLWDLLDFIEKETKAPMSFPFLTNIALWYWHWSNDQVGIGSLNS